VPWLYRYGQSVIAADGQIDMTRRTENKARLSQLGQETEKAERYQIRYDTAEKEK
jgi:hypothetical protein